MSYAGDDDWRRQEALKHLPSSEESIELMLNGMHDPKRLDVWMEVAREIDVSHQKMRMLREHRTTLNEKYDDSEDFQRASEIDEPTQAVADGGAEVVEDEEDDEWEPSNDQEVVGYDSQQRESLKQDVLSLLRENVDDADVLREKLEAERDSDRVRPHALDALEERLAEVEA